MAIQQPASGDKMNSPDHALSHRVFANDESSPDKAVVVDAAGKVGVGKDVPTEALDVLGNALASGTISGEKGVLLGATTETFTEGRAFWDSDFKTMAVESGGTGHEKTLQVGQEDWRFVTNTTETDISAGVLVYTTGASSGLAAVEKAQANMSSKSSVLGMTTEALHNGQTGMITVRGNVNSLDTEKIDSAYLTTQGILFYSEANGTTGNAYDVVFVSTAGEFGYTETATTITIDLGVAETQTTADVVALFTATPSALCSVREITAGSVVAATSVSLSGGVVTSEGQVLYLSPFVDGMATTIQPTSPNYDVRIGRLMTKSSTVGRINIRIIPSYALDGLNDVTTIAPTNDDVLTFNGTQWVNQPAQSISVDVGINFYMDDTAIRPLATNQNEYEVCSLLKIPATATATVVDSIVLSGTQTRFGEAYLYDTALGKELFNAGTWNFSTYCRATNNNRGSIQRYIYQVIPSAAGINFTTSGTGTSRTAIISASTAIFLAGDASATLVVGGYFQTEIGLYKITAVTNAYTATITTPTNYTNEVTKTFHLWRNLFGTNTGTITNTTTGLYSLVATTVIQGERALALTDKVGEIIFGTSTNNVTVEWTHNGTATYSNFRTPLIISHNDLAGVQGKVGEEAYHITAAQATVVANTSGTNTGDEPNASTTEPGIVELAIASEVNIGTDAGRAVTPDALAGSNLGIRLMSLKITDDATALTTGDGKMIFMIPTELNGMNLVSVAAYCTTVSSSGLPTFQIRNVTDSVDMLSTKVSIDASAFTSYAATTPAVIDTTKDDVVTGDRIAIDCDVAGTGCKGAGVVLGFALP